MLRPDHEARRERLRRALAAPEDPARRVEAFLVSGEANVGYLTGFTGDASMLLLTGREAVLLSDGRYTEQIAAECPSVTAEIRPLGTTMPEAIAEVVRRVAPKQLGFESTHLRVAEFEAIRDKLGPTGPALVGFAGRVDVMRAVKDEFEIEEIRRSVRAAERAFAIFRAGFRPDESEREAAFGLEWNLRRCGASGPSFPTIVASGSRSALPHARPTEAKVSAGGFVLVDWGASGSPYKSDLTRMIATDSVSTQFERIYRTVLAAQGAAIRALRPGVEARAIDAAARRVIEDAGYAESFPHSIGHGVGIEVHEAPGLRKESSLVLKAGMVVTIEPGIYLPGWGGIRIEDDVLITPDGGEILSQAPRDLESVPLSAPWTFSA